VEAGPYPIERECSCPPRVEREQVTAGQFGVRLVEKLRMSVDIVAVQSNNFSVGACLRSKLRRPLACAVKNAQDLDFVIADPIGNDARNN
jgi:hypothetical protein